MINISILSENCSLRLQCSAIIAKARPQHSFDEIRKIAAFQFETLRLSSLYEATAHVPEIFLPSTKLAEELVVAPKQKTIRQNVTKLSVVKMI